MLEDITLAGFLQVLLGSAIFLGVNNSAETLRDRWFGAVEVAQAIGTQRGVMHSWLVRGHVRVPSQGQGKSRRFSFSTVVELAVIAELTRMGMTVSAASAALDSVRRSFREALQTRSGEGQVLVIGADRAWVLPADTVPGFMRDLGVKSYATVVITNVAVDTFRALPGATATISGEAALTTEATTVRAKEQRAPRKRKKARQ